ncbi:hypothetical protein VVMO6_01235 [Vibrio vulnificus MO6-24/O]|nr:hypothetical protein VVMO6_01235 [Vibrio vulnificus MO6-24/O]
MGKVIKGGENDSLERQKSDKQSLSDLVVLLQSLRLEL